MARVQELTSAIVDLVIHDWGPVNVVDCVGFLHLMEVAEPRYTVPCRCAINGYIDNPVFSCQGLCEAGAQTS